ncbi:hypothetical protein [Amycolatopsis decaplanina]|uniref:hypothetical protein n=1 Tax=Amycolatopsis decaplanina TaxID=208441 RepID=UPI001268171B|nr:hypothetical protein [Amycolatopsis decaplanina]
MAGASRVGDVGGKVAHALDLLGAGFLLAECFTSASGDYAPWRYLQLFMEGCDAAKAVRKII